MPGIDIFISYARTDRPVAKHFAQRFEAEGFTVWWDAALHSGETFDEVIERNLRASRAVVVLWSSNSVKSRWVRAEATLADRLGKLAPIVIEECELPIIFQLTHTSDLTGWSGEADDPLWRRFVDDLRRAAQIPPGGAAAGQAQAAPALRRFDPERSAARLQSVPTGRGEVSTAVRDDPPTDSTQFWMAEEEPRADPLRGLGSDFHALEMVVDGQRGKRFVVTGAGLKIGRTAPSDIILKDPMVSRAHCLVELADEARW